MGETGCRVTRPGQPSPPRKPEMEVRIMAARHSSRAGLVPAVAYYRMSTDEQENSIPEQRKAVCQFAADKGYRILREYKDEGIGGDETAKRKDFQRMIADAERGEFRAVLCWDMDRFGRFDSIEAGRWIYPLRQAGVHLATVAQGVIDWSDFASRVLYGIQQESKHAYLRDLSRNVMRGMLDRALTGQWAGGKPPIGYVVGADGKLALGDERNIQAVRELFQGYLAGHSLRSLTEHLNAQGYLTAGGKPWNYVAVRFVLQNRNYTGDFVWNLRNSSKYNAIREGRIEATPRPGYNQRGDWIVIPKNHPAIVSPETYESANKRLRDKKANVSTPHRGGGEFVLSGLLRCGKCGSAMTGNTYSGNLYYVCCGYFHRGASFCTRNSVRQDELVDAVITAIEGEYLNPRTVSRIRAELERQADKGVNQASEEKLVKELGRVKGQLKTAVRNMALAGSGALRERYENVVAELADEEARLDSALKAASVPYKQRQANLTQTVDEAMRLLGRLRETFQKADRRLLREFLHQAVERVEVRTRDEPRVKRKRFYLDGGTIHVKTSNLFGTAR